VPRMGYFPARIYMVVQHLGRQAWNNVYPGEGLTEARAKLTTHERCRIAITDARAGHGAFTAKEFATSPRLLHRCPKHFCFWERIRLFHLAC